MRRLRARLSRVHRVRLHRGLRCFFAVRRCARDMAMQLLAERAAGERSVVCGQLFIGEALAARTIADSTFGFCVLQEVCVWGGAAS